MQNDLKKLDVEVTKDWEYYRRLAKDECVVCDLKLKDPEANYVVRGNYCAPCNASLGKRALRWLGKEYKQYDVLNALFNDTQIPKNRVYRKNSLKMGG